MINIFKYPIVSSPLKTDWLAFLPPNLSNLLAKFISLVDSILTLPFEDIPTEVWPLIKTLSVLAFITILLELSIIWGLAYDAGVVGGVVYETKFSFAILNGIFW